MSMKATCSNLSDLVLTQCQHTLLVESIFSTVLLENDVKHRNTESSTEYSRTNDNQFATDHRIHDNTTDIQFITVNRMVVDTR